MGLGLVPEHRELFVTMNVEDNLELGAFRIERSKAKASMERVYTLFPRLKERRKQLAGTLSGGEQQMLAMGRALMGEPKLLMLDEPSLGLAPIIVADIFRIVTELRAAGVSVLLVEQNAQAALRSRIRPMSWSSASLCSAARPATSRRMSASPPAISASSTKARVCCNVAANSPSFSPCGRRWRVAPDEGYLSTNDSGPHSRREPLTRLVAPRRATLSRKGRGCTAQAALAFAGW